MLGFGEHRFDPATGRLERNGQVIALRPRGIALLADLITRRNRWVARRELASRLWPASTVTDSSFSTLIAEVRRALGDDGRRQAVIRTRRGRGYRFVARVDASHESGPMRACAPAPSVAEGFGAAPRSQIRGDETDASASPDHVFSDHVVPDPLSPDQVAADSLESAWVAGPRHLDVRGPCPDAFVDEWARTAHERGFSVHRAHCDDTDSPALWPWWQISASMIESLEVTAGSYATPDDPESNPRGIWRRIRLEVEELTRRSGPCRASDTRADRQRRFALCHDVARALVRTAHHSPCAVVIEHLARADVENTRLLRFALMQIGPAPLWILTSRSAVTDAQPDPAWPLPPLSRSISLSTARSAQHGPDTGPG